MFHVICKDCKAELPGSPYETIEKANVHAKAFGIIDGVCELCVLVRKL